MNKQYKLLKDLPNLDAGAIFKKLDLNNLPTFRDRWAETYKNNTYYYCETNLNYVLIWDILESNKDWFEILPSFTEDDMKDFAVFLRREDNQSESIKKLFDGWLFSKEAKNLIEKEKIN